MSSGGHLFLSQRRRGGGGGGGDVTSSCPMKGAEERRSSRIVPSGGGGGGKGLMRSLCLSRRPCEQVKATIRLLNSPRFVVVVVKAETVTAQEEKALTLPSSSVVQYRKYSKYWKFNIGKCSHCAH